MRKSLHTTLAMLGVLFALLAWYFGYEKNYKLDKNTADDKAKILVSLEKDQIQELEVERLVNAPGEGVTPPADFKPEYQTVKMRKSGSDWNLYEPIQDSADSGTVSGMLGTLTTTRQDRVIDDKPKDLNEFGLKYPLVKIRVRKDAAAPAQEVWLGSNTPVGFNCYAKTSGGDTVYRVARSLRSGFEKTLKDLRNKSILSVPRLDISEVDIAERGRPSLVMKKIPNKDEWLLARENIPADTAEWNKTMNAVLDARATDFPDMTSRPLSSFGLEPAYRTVTVEKADKTKTVVHLGRVKAKGKDGKDIEKVYLKRADKETVFEVEKEVLSKVERAAEVYRSLQLSKFNRYDVNQVRLEKSDGLQIKKDNGKWVFSDDAQATVDPTKVDTLLTKLQDVRIEKYLSEHTPKLTDATLALTVRLFEKKTPEAAQTKDGKAAAAKATEGTETEVAVLKFGKAKNKLVTVERNDIPIPFTIKETDFNSLNLKKADLIQQEQKTEAKKEEPKKG